MGEPLLAPLVSAVELHEVVDDPRVRVLDASTRLHRAGEGEPYTAEPLHAAHLEARLPGAAFADVPNALSDADAAIALTVPSPAALAVAFAALGVGDDSHVVVYDTTRGLWATRVWWLLRYIGHDAVSVLDGGLAAWQAAGYAVESGLAPVDAPGEGTRPTLTPRERGHLLARVDEVAAVSGGSGQGASAGACLVNALDEATFRGEQDVNPYPRRGRIPGSVNLPFASLIDPQTGLLLPEDQLVERLRAAGILGADRAIAYCGGGIAATMPAFAAYLVAGVDVAVYDGSLSEWTADENRPVELG